MDPESILPEEVWKLIINKLSTHTDKLIAYNTCQLWRSFLTKTQSQWMFPAVFPSLLKYLEKSDILKCRVVCKSWNKQVENYLEEHQPSVTAPGSHYLFNLRPRFRIFVTDMEKTGELLGLNPLEALQRFQAQFAAAEGPSRNKNPFLSRALHITIADMNLSYLNFFEKFGAHLYTLQLSIWQLVPSEFTSPAQIARFIWNILSRVPNLRKLDLHTVQKFNDFPGSAPNEEEKVLLNQELQQFLENNLAPTLPHLTNLQVDVNFPLMHQVLETAYAPQLTKYVHITPKSFVPDNLTSLSEVAWCFTDGIPNEHLNELQSLDTPSLQRLHLYVAKFGGRLETQCQTELLFKAIETFKSSLTHLSIFWRVFEPKFSKHLDLPFVQEVNLEISRCHNLKAINFSFLANLKSLRKLKCVFWKFNNLPLFDIHRDFEKDGQTEESIDLQLHLDDDMHEGPYKSNIWRLVPSLDAIQIQIVGNTFSPKGTLNKYYTRSNKETWELFLNP